MRSATQGFLRVLSLLTCLMAIGASHAQGTQLLQPVGPSLMDVSGSGPVLGPAGYYSPSTPQTWMLLQWGIQWDVSPAPGAPSGWSIANQYARAQYYPQIDGGQNVYELAQAGNSPCYHERDLFLQTGDPGGFPGTSSGMTRSASLDTIGSIRVDVGLNQFYSDIQATCSLNYSQYVYSIILGSTTGQTLFYQIDMGGSGNYGRSIPNVSWCPAGYEDTANAAFCLDDDVSNLGGTWVDVNNNVVNSFDFLPRLLQIIKAGHAKSGFPSITLDQDPSHWTMGAVYVGEVNQGGSISGSRWYDLGLRTWQGGTFCNGTNTVQWSCWAGQPDGTGWVDVGYPCFHRNTGLACM